MVAKKRKKLKKIALKKKAERLKKITKKPWEVLFKIKPLKWTEQVKLKKPSKSIKLLTENTIHPLPPSAPRLTQNGLLKRALKRVKQVRKRKIERERPKIKQIKPVKTKILLKKVEKKITKPKLKLKTTKVKKSRTRAKLGAGLTPHRPDEIGTGAGPLEEPIYKTRIRVIGIGGGGSSIVSEIASEVKKVSFVVANTDSQTLRGATKAVRHFQFGKSITQGLGTGMNPELGEQAAESDKEKIKELLKETDFCILISCLGGGTGSGASPVFANILKNLGILTLGIFTLPFKFEGGKRAQIARDSLEKLRQNLNALVIIPNQKIFQIIDKNTPLKEALSTINKALIESLEGLITLIHSPGLINVDFADLKTILAGRGRLAYLNSVEAKDPNQIKELVKRILSNPLFSYSTQGAKEVLFNIDGGLNLNMSQIEQIGKTISDSISPKARVVFGVTQNKKRGIKITLLANGCKWEEWEEWAEKKTPLPKIQPEAPQISTEEQPEDYNPPTTLPPKWASIKITARENALGVQKPIGNEEKKMLSQERKWETPAFLRRGSGQINEEKEV